jgi:hypothetical protein
VGIEPVGVILDRLERPECPCIFNPWRLDWVTLLPQVRIGKRQDLSFALAMMAGSFSQEFRIDENFYAAGDARFRLMKPARSSANTIW